MPKLKLLTTFITTIFLLIISTSTTYALSLTAIGSSSTSGSTLTEWWHLSDNPLLQGSATASSSVTITIDSASTSTTTDSTGNWTHQPTTLTLGDHQVIITSGGETITFTLHIGQSAPTNAQVATQSAQLPVTGSLQTTITLLGLGTLTLITGLYFYSKPAPLNS